MVIGQGDEEPLKPLDTARGDRGVHQRGPGKEEKPSKGDEEGIENPAPIVLIGEPPQRDHRSRPKKYENREETAHGIPLLLFRSLQNGHLTCCTLGEPNAHERVERIPPWRPSSWANG